MLEEVIMKKHSLFKVILIVLGSLIAVDAILGYTWCLWCKRVKRCLYYDTTW